MRSIVRYAASILLLLISSASADEPVCATRTDLAGPCFEATGTLRIGNGTPSARIALSNGRTLGIPALIQGGNETFSAPSAVRAAVGLGRSVTGRFWVCPLQQARAAGIRLVCIDSMQTSRAGEP